MRLSSIHEQLSSYLRLSESRNPDGTAGFSRPGATPRRRRKLLLPAWLIGCFLASPVAASAQGVCDRTPQVRDKLVEATRVPTCENVAPEHLAAVTQLDLSESGIGALQPHDFRDLGRLQRLYLRGNSLTTLPSSLFHGLVRLEQLGLNANRLRELPPELFVGLGSLEWLWLNENQLETLPNGVFSGLAELTYLNLAENFLTDLPAGVFTGLVSLENLSLLRNALNVLPDRIFSGLSNLNQLLLQENSLAALPEEIFRGLVNLRTLKLDHNQLETLGSATFPGLRHLQRLTLDSNSLRELPEGVFAGLNSLVELQLRQNRLRTLPEGIFNGLRLLQTLTLDENSLRVLPEGVFDGLSQLVQLPLQGNDLRTLPEGIFNGLRGLKRLTLNRNSLRTLPAGLFRGLPLLRDLALEDNQLADLPKGVFDDNLASLGAVRDSPGLRLDAALKAEAAFVFPSGTAAPGAAATATVTLHRPLPMAVRLPYRLGGTATPADYAGLSPAPDDGLLFPAGETRRQISLAILAGADKLGKTVVFTLGELSEIRLRRSDGTEPDAPFLPAEALLSLSPDGRSHTLTVADAGSITGGICDRTPQVRDKLVEAAGVSACGQVTSGQLAAVTLLDLRRSGIHALEAQDFNGLSSLTRLSLGENRLETIPEEIFSGLGSLQRLEMPGNALSALPRDVFSGLSGLTWLDLRSNALTELPEGIFSGLLNLETLWLNGNSLTELPEATFENLGRLVDLNLGFNSLAALPEGVFDGMNALQALKLHENSLRALPGGLFLELSEPEEFIPIGGPTRAARLESIWLQGNRLSALPEDAFQGLGNLRALLLDGNSLTTLPEGVFQGLSRLQLLRLGDNSIASLPEEIFRGLENLERLAMDHNRLTTLPGAVFDGLSRLARLNLSANALASLPPEIFQGLRRLEELHLNGNRLAALPPGVLDDALSELGIGPGNQGLHVDADLKARLGFAVGVQSAAPGSRATVTVTLHRALPVSLRVPFSVGGTASSDDFAGLSPSPDEGLVFPAGETRTEITLVLLENAGVGRNIVLTLGQTPEIDLLPSDPTGPEAPFLKAETLLSGSADPATHTITLAVPAVVGLNRAFVPVILSRAGRSNSFFSSEMTLTNRGAAEAALTYVYTAHQGGGSGTATDLLAVGRQKIVPDAVEYLRGLGVPIPAGGNPIGTLAVEYSGDSTVGVSVRTTTPVPQGRAGLAYSGVSREDGFQDPVYVAGLRQTPQDRSNLAIQNMGSPAEEPIRLRVTVYSGDAGDSGHKVFDDIVLESGGFLQFDGVLGSLANGYVRVEKTAGAAPFYAYGVINDQVNSDGSFVHPVTVGSLESITGQTLPVILERGSFTSELTVTNFSDRPKTVSFAFVAEGVDAPDLTAEFSMRLEAGEQVITPNLVDEMRRQDVPGIGPSGGLAGALFAWVEGADMSGIVIGARTVSPALVAGGQYGVFYNAVPYGSAFSRVAWVEGLQQNQESRSNLALVNTGEADNSESVFSIDIYDGDTGLLVRTITGRTVPARGWLQIDSILRDYAAGTTQGYVRIRKISGNNPFLAYGVINDGGSPGERSGDGAFLAARE